MSLPFVDISSTVNYFPITANYDEVDWLVIDWLVIDWLEIDRPDENYNGMLVNGEVGKEWFRIPFIVNVAAGLSWMNSEYAEANYSVNYATGRLDTFEAKSGLHDVHVSAIVTMMFNERLGTTLMTESQYLLNDAADSPLVQNTFQPSAGLFLFYRF